MRSSRTLMIKLGNPVLRLQWIYLKKKLLKERALDGWNFVCPYGIGDTYIVCSLLRTFLKQSGDTSVRIFVQGSHASIPSMFGFEDVIVVKNLKLAQQERNSKLKKGELVCAHPICFNWIEDLEKIGSGDYVFSDLLKRVLGLPRETVFNQPKVKKEYYKSSKEILEKKSYIPKKTVILAPSSISTKTIPVKFWLTLYDDLQEKGFKVFFNKVGNDEYGVDKETISFSLGEAIPLVEQAGVFIGVRSGLCDLLSTSKARMIIIYPEARWFSGTVYSGASLRKMGLSEKALEIVYKEKHKHEIIEKILRALK